MKIPFRLIMAILPILTNTMTLMTTSKRQLGTSSTQNDILSSTPCKSVTVIFARGTTEAGNVGSVAGPPFFAALATKIGASNLAVQGVDHFADVSGFFPGGGTAGDQTMAGLVTQILGRCPTTKVVLSGYSQGGMLVHASAAMLSAGVQTLISSVVVFGDPDNGQPVASIPASKVLVVCHAGDNICEHGFMILPPHLTYGQDAGTAAAFVASHAGTLNTSSI